MKHWPRGQHFMHVGHRVADFESAEALLAPVELQSQPVSDDLTNDHLYDHLSDSDHASEPVSRLTQIILLTAVIVPPIALVVGAYFAWGHAFNWWQLVMVIAMYFITGLGVTLGYHRLFTHSSYQAAAPVRALLGVMAGMAVQGPLLWWVATHRRHHQHSDRELDPHSPHAAVPEGAGFLGKVKGFMHAHMGWLFREHESDVARYAPDLAADPLLRVISNLFPLWVALGIALPAAVGWMIDGGYGALLGFLWGGLARIALLHHVTWSINSVCHVWGAKPFRSGDESRNNVVMGLLGFGEGWHNNHHAFPTSARHGLRWWQFDITWILIRVMEVTGLVWKVRVPTADRMLEKQVSP